MTGHDLRNRSAPAALPAQSEGCGGAENKKAPINIEALNRCACLPTLPAKDLPTSTPKCIDLADLVSRRSGSQV